MNHKNGGLPPSIREWIRALSGEIAWSELQPFLAPGVVHSIGGRETRGVDSIVHLMQGRAATLAGVTWTAVQGEDDAGRHVIRGTIPGKTLPSPGGPMSALDFAFGLDPGGRIAEISPRPHHLEPTDLRPPLQVGSRIGPFELTTLDGKVFRADPIESGILLVVFTCNHCPWALGWHDRLQAVVRDYRPRGVEVLQVNANDTLASPFDATARSLERVAHGEFSGHYLCDPGQRIARAWGARHTPEAFLFAAAGTLVYHGALDADFQDDTLAAGWLREALDAVLENRGVPVARTVAVGCTIKWTL